jgi:putative membrane protein
MLFAIVHGAAVYGPRGIAVFTALCLGVGFAFEEIGVATGFPFGRYYFTGAMGPKLGYVPILLGLAYLGMGYLSWTLARLLVGGKFAPLLAAALMTTWDLALDPIWSTVERGWVWLDGGPYFGVPLLNFFGWMLTNYVICQCFDLYARRHARERSLSIGFWKAAIAFYAVSAFGNCLQVFRLRFHAPSMDPAGRLWNVGPILEACCLVSVLGMGSYAALAWIKAGQKASSLP